MEKFLSTAGRYLKGESGLPSLLPAKAEIEAAKGKFRRVGLFCKGLETLCEALYADPIPQEARSPGQDPIAAEVEEGEKSKGYVLAPSEDLFQSLYATDKTPPASPGGASSSSTLVDPSSRKVSPSDSMMGAKESPTAVKDFAYSSLDGDPVRDPVAFVEEKTKLELLRQLKKKTAGERKAARKAEKRKARNDALKAELDAATGKLRNQEVRADLATVQANAMILSNFVLRHGMRDLKRELSGEPVGAKVEEITSAGEMLWNGQDEGSPQSPQGSAGELPASAYDPTRLLEYFSDELGKGLDDEETQGCTQQDNASPNNESGESQPSGSIAVDVVKGQESEEEQAERIVSCNSTGASEAQSEVNAGSLDRPKGKVEILSKEIGSDEIGLSGTTSSSNPAKTETLNKVKAHGVNEAMDEIGIAIDQDKQQGLDTYNVSAKREGTDKIPTSEDETEDQIGSERPLTGYIFQAEAYSEPILPHSKPQTPTDHCNQAMNDKKASRNQDASEFSGEEPALVANDDNQPPARQQNTKDIPIRAQAQGTCVGYEGGSYGSYEFSEPAGPATLWGILQSSRCGDEAKKEGDACEKPARFSDAAGPATLWGILQSDQSEDEPATPDEESADVSATPDQAGAKGVYGLATHAIARIRPDFAAQLREEVDPFVKRWETAQTNEDKADVHEIGGVETDAIMRALFPQVEVPTRKKYPKKPDGVILRRLGSLLNPFRSRMLGGPSKKPNDQKTRDVAHSVSRIITTAENDEVSSRENSTLSPIPSDSRVSAPYSVKTQQVEKFDLPLQKPQVAAPKSQAAELSKTQKRKLERKRAAARKTEAEERGIGRKVPEHGENDAS